jgi:hypothetical protein
MNRKDVVRNEGASAPPFEVPDRRTGALKSWTSFVCEQETVLNDPFVSQHYETSHQLQRTQT